MNLGDRKVLASLTSTYCHYAVVELMYNGRPARVLFAGSSSSAQSGVALDDDDQLLFDYNERFMELVNESRPASVLVLGGGGFTLPTAVKARWPGMQIVAVEHDKALDGLARRFFGLSDSPGYVVEYGDARQYLERLDRKFDTVIVDVYDEEQIPADMDDASAVSLLARACAPGGMVACNLIGALHGFGSSAINRRKALFGRFFELVEVAVASKGASGWGSQNLILTARGPIGI